MINLTLAIILMSIVGAVMFLLGWFRGADYVKEVFNKVSKTPVSPDDYEAINRLGEEFYTSAKDKGWHTGPVVLGNYLSNLHSEVSELWEAERNNKLDEPCDKAEKMIEKGIEPLSCKEEELADIFIRTLDTAVALDVDMAKAVRNKHLFNGTREHRHGGKKA